MNKSYWKNPQGGVGPPGGSAAFSVVAPAASLSGRDQAGGRAALLRGGLARAVARLAGLCAAAKHLRHREKWIGWTEAQRRKRLGLVTNNARFLILPQRSLSQSGDAGDGVVVQAAAAGLAGALRPSGGWRRVLWTPSCSGARPGKASGWTELGPTQGYGRSQQDYYVKHDRPKALFVKELKPNARRSLLLRRPPHPRRWRWWWKTRCRCRLPARCAWGNCARYALILPRCRTFAGRVRSY